MLIIPSQLVKRAVVITSFTLLASCGGGGGSSESSYSYDGSKDPALLDEENVLLFSRLVFGNTLESTPLTRSRPEAVDQVILFDKSSVISSINNSVLADPASSDLHHRLEIISKTENCRFGGTLQKEGKVDDTTNAGTINLTYANCEQDEDVILQGNASIITHSDDYPKSWVTTLDELEVTQDSEVFALTGKIENLIEFDSETGAFKRYETRNLLSNHVGTNYSTYFENVVNEISSLGYDEVDNGYISGKIYIEDQGYVTLSSAEGFIPYYISSRYGDLPQQGTAFLTGGSASSGRITHINTYANGNIDGFDEEIYRLDLDKNGDGIYEIVSTQYYHAPLDGEFTSNQTPTAVIVSSDTNYIRNCVTRASSRQFYKNSEVHVFAECSEDAELDEMSYQWTLEEVPEESSATLDATRSTAISNSFIADVKGTYKVGLKVTDLGGSGNSDYTVLDIVSPDYPPSVHIYPYIDSLDMTEKDGFTFDVRYSDDSREAVTVHYEWITKPEGSSAALKITSSEVSERDQYYGNWLDESYYIAINTPGNYILELTVTDEAGLSSSMGVTFYASE